VLTADDAVGVAHAGWRGAASGVVARLCREMTASGHPSRRAAIGPGISACCFEVGTEVAERFEGHISTTTWGSTSVDLSAVLSAQVDGLDTWESGACTHHDQGWFSHRVNGTKQRLAAVGWLW
ncbi:MAG: laccase domain-containing protein, partial [Acidimicrobiia bacterium]